MRLLVTGSDGYIGSVLAPLLAKGGHEVVGFDTGFYRSGWLYNALERTPASITRDLRRIGPEDLRGIEGVVHLAELSNDPAGQLAPHVTHEINHQGSVHLATLARAAGARRFVYMSSCSVYGIADGLVDETSALDPRTAYAECKVLVERDVSALADERFTPTFLRNATAFGASPRIRFDLVVNNLAGLAWTTRRIAMTSDGSPWRPLVHVLDIAQAVACALEAPREAVLNQVFNVGDTAQNYRVREIAETVGRVFEGCEISFGAPSRDDRSYRVSFDKIRRHLPGFRCEWDLGRGVRQLHELFRYVNLDAAAFKLPAFTRLAQLQHLLRTGQIDQEFYWRELPGA